MIARRARAQTETAALQEVAGAVPRMLADDQHELLVQATTLRDERTRSAEPVDDPDADGVDALLARAY